MISRFRTGPEDKPLWRSIPEEVRAAVQDLLGGKVTSARRVWGGYTPSATFRLGLDNGGTAFFKGVSTEDMSTMQAAVRMEAQVYTGLTGIQPWAPRLLGMLEIEGWYILLLEYIPDARGARPWTERHVRAVMQGLAGMHRAFVGRPLPGWLPSASRVLLQPPSGPAGWRSLADSPEGPLRLAALAGPASKEALAWAEEHLASLASLEVNFSAPRGATTLLHMDVRSDNLLFRRDGTVALVDWPLASIGAGVADAVGFAITVAAEGGPAPEDTLSWYIEALGENVNTDDLTGAVAAFAGYFASRACLADIPGLPRVRPWQRAQLVTGLGWLCRLQGLPVPGWLSRVRPQPGVAAKG